MATFQADTGLTGSVVGSLFGQQAAGSAAAPPRTFMPEAPVTISQGAYGGGAGYAGNCGMHALIGGIVSLALLIGIWVTLPR